MLVIKRTYVMMYTFISDKAILLIHIT